jgi:exopolyphosphatase/guanosine-5'-triphosphate,3'-diphosphate pyrophosphatase
MTERIAIIDLGTNTFHLLIAEKDGGSYRIVHRDRHPVKIGKGRINENVITDSGVERAIDAILNFKKKIDSLRVREVFTFGTSALRNASNRNEVIEKIKSATGIDFTVISGAQEAEFIYYGVRSALDLGPEKSLIVDIGGGSVEFIIANEHGIFWKQSVDIGAQRLLERFQKHDPILAEEIEELNVHFKSTLFELFDALKAHNPLTLAGSSGTFDTLSDIFCIQKNISKTDDDREGPLSIDGFYTIYNELIGKNRAARLAIPGMIEMRVDMIVVACCLIRYLLERHDFKKIRVSGYSLKEGVLAQLSTRRP